MASAAKISAETVGIAARERLAGFARTLRDNGFRVGHAETRDALTLFASGAAERAETLKAAFRTLFCANHSDWERFDPIFDGYWHGRYVRQIQQVNAAASQSKSVSLRQVSPKEGEPQGIPDKTERLLGDDSGVAGGSEATEGASRAENIARIDIRHLADPADMAKAHRLAEHLAKAMRARLVRRQQIRNRGRRLDIRRSIHRNVSHGGTLIDLFWRKRKDKPLRLVVLLDASGSMNLYTAFFIRFLHGIVDAFREAEAFVFHTRLAHVSASMRDQDVGRAVDRLSLMAQGIGGGTRIGESLATFNRWHARRVINSRTAVMIVSDGYDTGEPEVLAEEMRKLRRRCRRIVWLNPLIGWKDYEPRARGMKAALSYVDLFAPAHNLESLAALEPYLARI